MVKKLKWLTEFAEEVLYKFIIIHVILIKMLLLSSKVLSSRIRLLPVFRVLS